MKSNSYLIKVDLDYYEFIKKVNYYHLNLKVKNKDTYLIDQAEYKRLIKLMPYLKINILRDTTKSGLYTYFKKHLVIIILLLSFILSYFSATNLIVKVHIKTSDTLLKNNVKVSLKNHGINAFTFKKDYQTINKIKKALLVEYQDEIEWLEIKRIGMTYEVDIVKRVNRTSSIEDEYCNIYASSEGLIRRVIYEHGILQVNINDLVKKDELLISGKILKGEELKAYVCATGKVYAEVWYQITLSIPRYKNIKITKPNHNLCFKNKCLFKNEIIYQKSYFSENELNSLANQLIKDKLDIKFNKDYTILHQNVLKKALNDSTINMVVFVSIETDIAKIVVEKKE